MRRDHPDWPMNPYPESWSEITGFAYRSALSLMRPLGMVTSRLGEDASYVLQHDFLFDYAVDGREMRRIVVPRGLLTDLTTVPRLLRAFVGRVGPWLEAAILHDYLYIAWQDVPGLGPRDRDRLFADRMMLRAMEAAEVGVVERRAIYLAVRAFGETNFRCRTEDHYVDLADRNMTGALAFRLPAPRMAPSGARDRV